MVKHLLLSLDWPIIQMSSTMLCRAYYVFSLGPFPQISMNPNSVLATPCSLLVKLPTHTPEDILNGNHKQLRGGKKNAAHQETTNFIYMITRPEIGFTDRPWNIQNPSYTILLNRKYCTSDLVSHYSSRILGCKQKCQIKPLLYGLEVLSRIPNDAFPPNDV